MFPATLLAVALTGAAALSSGCSSDDDATSSAGGGPAGEGGAGGGGAGGAGGAGGTSHVFGGDRPVDVFVPSGYQEDTPAPLVILLHGFTASGGLQELYFQFRPLAEAHGFLYAHPDGTTDPDGSRFWNATDACCNFHGSTVDDSAYLRELVEEIQAHYAVDPKRIYFVGHSNGGFMSYRMACDHADLVAAVVSLAGAMVSMPSQCAATEPVSVLQIHGTDDDTVKYEGDTFAGIAYPSALASVEHWAELGGCDASPTSGEPLDLEADIGGAETTTQTFGGCASGVNAALWSIQGGSHLPSFTSAFGTGVFDFLLSHPKP
ncbi:uncharacterized protein CMC5_034870 [Chondromyces crocatus]|uniref:Uncharacterized protein n=2 Tax=Chondromyces crocatus TaxID=52 RepID=A0A0K1EEP2_CHOCO|nr:uncharacterized protein CMC5_034870 [Chondromyces crocatus]